MNEELHIRWGWLKFMYIYTILGAGGFGLGIVLFPKMLQSMFAWPSQDPILFGAYGSVLIGFGILSALGLRDPLKFIPVLLFQLCYKLIWFLFVFIPVALQGDLPMYRVMLAFIFATYVIGDFIAIPFPYLLKKAADNPPVNQ